MKVLCVFGQHNYGEPGRGEGYEYANFIPTLRRLGHEVLFLESWNRTAYPNFQDLNLALLQLVERERPDVVLSVQMHYEIWLETWQILRDAGITATVNWATDDSWKYEQFSRLVAPAFHAFTTTYPAIYGRYRRDGFGHVLLTQWAASASRLQAPLPAAGCDIPVSFVGTAYGQRLTWVEALAGQGIEVTCFGHGWPAGPVAAEAIPGLIRRSVISLNFANTPSPWQVGPFRPANQVKARTFEVPGAGGFLLTEQAEGLEQYYLPGREMAVFANLAELAGQIRHYLACPAERDAVARAGYERTRAEHTYDRRLAEVLVFARQQAEAYFARPGWPPGGQIDWTRFEAAARRHTLDFKLALLRRVLLAPCVATWGPVRGPRAARRFLFELSWRCCGAQTYSAAGWPGRMFYKGS